jgi:putative ABC transport system permease protein
MLDERMTGGAALPWEIVGVVRTVKITGSDPGDRPIIYTPRLQSPGPGGILAVRAEAQAGLARAVRSAIAAVDRDVPVTDVRTMKEVAAASMARPRSQTWIIGSFAVVALILAALGIHGVMAYTVSQTTREMGLRIALGAQPRELLSMTVRRGAAMAVLGLALGFAGALALKHVVESLLFQVKTTDPPTYVAVSVLLLAVAMPAAYIPARRASRVDPLVALRWE